MKRKAKYTITTDAAIDHPGNNGYIASPAWNLRPGLEEAAYWEIKGLLERRTCA